MSTQSLPAPSLRTGHGLPAVRWVSRVVNYLIYQALWLILPAISGSKPSFLPALREGPGASALNSGETGAPPIARRLPVGDLVFSGLRALGRPVYRHRRRRRYRAACPHLADRAAGRADAGRGPRWCDDADPEPALHHGQADDRSLRRCRGDVAAGCSAICRKSLCGTYRSRRSWRRAYGWAALLAAIGLVNLITALHFDFVTWAWFVSVGAVGAKLVAFALQYGVFRTVIR